MPLTPWNSKENNMVAEKGGGFKRDATGKAHLFTKKTFPDGWLTCLIVLSELPHCIPIFGWVTSYQFQQFLFHQLLILQNWSFLMFALPCTIINIGFEVERESPLIPSFMHNQSVHTKYSVNICFHISGPNGLKLYRSSFGLFCVSFPGVGCALAT